MIKKIFITLTLFTFSSFGNSTSFGFNFMAGGRYDNLRMCVATPAGVKGGPIADIVLDFRFTGISDKITFGFKLPLMRPILFGAAFKMLQFEPEFICEYEFPLKDNLDFILGPGLGASFHWGPDYTTALDTPNRKDFFAAGPFISTLFGLHFKNAHDHSRTFGVRAFYVPLFSKDRKPGTVVGAAIEGHFFRTNH